MEDIAIPRRRRSAVIVAHGRARRDLWIGRWVRPILKRVGSVLASVKAGLDQLSDAEMVAGAILLIAITTWLVMCYCPSPSTWLAQHPLLRP